MDRRNFLKAGVLGTMALTAMPHSVEAAPRRRRGKMKAKRVLIVALDAIRVDGLQQAHTPVLDELMSKGSVSLATRSVMPSITLPNWTSHLCGSGPEQHGVADNKWEYGKAKLPGIVLDEDGYYPSIFKVLKDNVPGVKTAFYRNWNKLMRPYNKKYFDDEILLPFGEYKANYDRAFEFMKENKDVPSLTFLYTVHTDKAGHNYGWMSPEYITSIEEADVEIGKLFEKMKAEGIYDDTHIFFLTDHGGIGKSHGKVSKEEMVIPWSLTGPGIKSGFTMEESNSVTNTACVIARLFGVEVPSFWIGQIPESIFR